MLKIENIRNPSAGKLFFELFFYGKLNAFLTQF